MMVLVNPVRGKRDSFTLLVISSAERIVKAASGIIQIERQTDFDIISLIGQLAIELEHEISHGGLNLTSVDDWLTGKGIERDFQYTRNNIYQSPRNNETLRIYRETQHNQGTASGTGV
jgi:hypothetical protein